MICLWETNNLPYEVDVCVMIVHDFAIEQLHTVSVVAHGVQYALQFYMHDWRLEDINIRCDCKISKIQVGLHRDGTISLSI